MYFFIYTDVFIIASFVYVGRFIFKHLVLFVKLIQVQWKYI